MVGDEELRRRRREELGQKIRELRTQRKLSQEALAILADLDRSFLVEVENAKHSITVDRLYSIADALDVEVAELFNGPAAHRGQ